MRTYARRILVLSVFTLPALVACTSDDSNPLLPEDAGECANLGTSDICRDSSIAIPDSGCVSVGGRLICGDSAVPTEDAGEDATLGDGGLDATAPDANEPDAAAPDASDAGGPDASDAGGPGANDAGADANDGASTQDAGVDATDAAPPSCVVGVFGDYYIRSDGTVWYMTTNTEIVDSTAKAIGPISEVMEQLDHACALRSSDGTVWCWPTSNGGGNSAGDLGNGTVGGNTLAFVASEVVTQEADAGAEVYLTGVTSISTRSHAWYTEPTCAIRSDRTLWCWGNSGAEGSPPDGLFWGTIASRNSVDHAIQIALTNNDAGLGTSFVTADQVVVGDRHLCYLDSGSVYCLGQNVAGNLGTGDTTARWLPVQVQTGFGLPATVDQISAAYDVTCALSGGGVWCWGSNSQGQIGNPYIGTPGSNDLVPTPVQVSLPDGGAQETSLTGMTQLTGGYLALCALDGTGSTWCWGASAAGVTYVKEATRYVPTGSVPYTNVTSLSMWGEDFNSGLRYLTSGGALVQANKEITPVCP